TVLDGLEESGYRGILIEVQEAPTGSLLFGMGINSDNGLFGSVISPEEPVDSQNSQNIEGPRVGQLVIVGNDVTPDRVILEAVEIYPGQLLQAADLRRAEDALAKLGLFVVDAEKGVRPTVTALDEENGYRDILITVKESRSRADEESNQN